MSFIHIGLILFFTLLFGYVGYVQNNFISYKTNNNIINIILYSLIGFSFGFLSYYLGIILLFIFVTIGIIGLVAIILNTKKIVKDTNVIDVNIIDKNT